MNTALAWFARNGVAANLLMVLIVLAGAVAVGKQVRRELIPNVSLDIVRVAVPYPGATPVEVEEGVILRVEEALADLDGMDEMTSYAAEGMGTVVLETADGYDVRDLLDDTKSRVDAIATFPEDAEEPVIDAPSIRHRVLALAVVADLDEAALRRQAERVRDALLNHRPEPASRLGAILGRLGLARDADLSQVELGAVRDYEIGIEVSEAAMERYGLTFDEVRAAVQRGSLDLPAGAIKRYEGEVLLRTQAQAYTGAEFADLVLRSLPDGRRILLGDVARIDDGFAGDEIEARLDGRPAAFVDVYAVGDQDILAVSAAVKDFVARSGRLLPEGVELAIWDDTSKHFQSRLDTLGFNAVVGLIMVFIILSLFLHLRLALWVSLGIPVSFLGALWVMPQVDASINMISMFAFILVLGIVVDDAIVVAESVHTCQEEENGGRRDALLAGAIRGAQRVAMPVFFAVATSVTAFMPMLFLGGVSGKFFRLIPVVVIGCLFFSLLESFFILPSHLSHRFPLMGSIFRYPLVVAEGVQGLVERALFAFIDRVYRPCLRWALRWRYLTAALFVAALALTAGLFVGGLIPTQGFPTFEGDRVTANLTMPLGTSVERTRQIIDRIGRAAAGLRERYDRPGAPPVIGRVFSAVGARLEPDPFGRPGSSANVGEVMLLLENIKEQGVRPTEVATAWREAVGAVPEAETLEFKSSLGRDSNRITLQIRGRDLDDMLVAVGELERQMASYETVYGVTDSYSGGKEELVLDLTPVGEAAGLRAADLGRQVRSAVYGIEAQRIQRGRDEVKVMVRYPEATRESLRLLDVMRVRTPDGAALPLRSVADLSWGTGSPVINRQDRQRAVDVTCHVALDQGGNTDRILGHLREEFLPDLLARHPGLSWSLKEAAKDQAEAKEELAIGFVVALVVMYGLMAVAFGSYLQPAVIMVSIPFGIVGAVWAHLVLGLTVSMISMFGLVALSGVVVNDALVLIDQVNRLRAEGKSVREALAASGPLRFRAILLTTLTTFFGLVPMMLETSVQAQAMIPMAISLAFGVLFATSITLILIPCLYEILEDIREAGAGIYRKLSAPSEKRTPSERVPGRGEP